MSYPTGHRPVAHTWGLRLESSLELSSVSRNGLFDQLTSQYGSQFTPEQAEYALSKVGY